MSTPVRVAAFVTALALVFVAAWGAGRLAEDRVEVEAATDNHSSAAGGSAAGDGHGDEDPAAVGTAADHQPGGLMLSQEGYTLDLRRPEDRTGVPGRVSFAIAGPDGEAVTDFDVEHEKRLHLIVVRRDVAGFQHVHPTMAADGTWSVPVALSPGTWRLLADFTPTGGPALTLGTDLQVPGDFAPRPEPPVTRSVAVDDYVVTLAGELEPGEESTVTATVQRRGRPVSHLDPYLGAAGHLVALREGDLAYLHVHPEDGPPGPEVGFAVEVPSEGRYRLFLDFSHGGIVRTAAFTLATSGHPSTPEGDDHGHD